MMVQATGDAEALTGGYHLCKPEQRRSCSCRWETHPCCTCRTAWCEQWVSEESGSCTACHLLDAAMPAAQHARVSTQTACARMSARVWTVTKWPPNSVACQYMQQISRWWRGVDASTELVHIMWSDGAVIRLWLQPMKMAGS